MNGRIEASLQTREWLLYMTKAGERQLGYCKLSWQWSLTVELMQVSNLDLDPV